MSVKNDRHSRLRNVYEMDHDRPPRGKNKRRVHKRGRAFYRQEIAQFFNQDLQDQDELVSAILNEEAD